MNIKVYKYGAFAPDTESNIRQQMKLGREYYNKLVEAENNRRKLFWEGDTPPKPPHDHSGENKCEECIVYWKVQRERWRTIPPIDLKPHRSSAVIGGLYWGTYLIVEEAFNLAWKKTDCFSLVKYRSWKQGGYAGVQIQHQATSGMYFKIEHRDDSRIGTKRRGTKYKITIRTGTEGIKPIWSDQINFIMHRPLQGNPRSVKICMHYSGEKEIWSINITCADVPERIDKANSGVVAIDVGWRVIEENKLRISYAIGDDNKEYEFAMDADWRELSVRADRIRGHRDNRLDVLKIAVPQLNVLKKPSSVKPYLEKNGMLTPELDTWCKQDRHLAQYEIGCRRRSRDKRHNDMRVWLRNLRRQYKIVIIKDSIHKRIKCHKHAIDDGISLPIRRNAHHAAPGEVIEEICKIWNRQTEVAIVDAKNTTATCPLCGYVSKIGSEQFIICERCGVREDRDRISTRNLLDLYEKGEYKKPTARKTTARFAKRHKNYVETQQCPPNGL